MASRELKPSIEILIASTIKEMKKFERRKYDKNLEVEILQFIIEKLKEISYFSEKKERKAINKDIQTLSSIINKESRSFKLESNEAKKLIREMKKMVLKLKKNISFQEFIRYLSTLPFENITFCNTYKEGEKAIKEKKVPVNFKENFLKKFALLTLQIKW